MVIASLNDPTEDGYLDRSAVAQGDCPTGFLSRSNDTSEIRLGGRLFGGAYYAFRGYIEWDISPLFGATLIANPIFKYEGGVADTDEEINPIPNQPSVTADATLWTDIVAGTAYVDPWNLEVGIDKQVDLGASAKSDLQAAIDAARSWFAIGLANPNEECQIETTAYVYIKSEEATPTPPPTLYLEYETLVVDGDLIGIGIIKT